MTNISEIAKRLSDGQRNYLLDDGGQLRINSRYRSLYKAMGFGSLLVTERQLQRRGIMGNHTLTPLGVKVRG